MSNLLEIKTNPLADAVTISRFLRFWLTAPDLATFEQMEAAFIELPKVVEALPPTVADPTLMCYLRNRVWSSIELKETGDFNTAAYQLQEIHLKLMKRMRGESQSVPFLQKSI